MVLRLHADTNGRPLFCSADGEYNDSSRYDLEQPDLASLSSRAPRASWTQTELFLTFPSPTIRSITLMPTMENGGRFRVWVTGLTSAQAEKAAAEGGQGNKDGWVLVWDRKVEGGFPEVSLIL